MSQANEFIARCCPRPISLLLAALALFVAASPDVSTETAMPS